MCGARVMMMEMPAALFLTCCLYEDNWDNASFYTFIPSLLVYLRYRVIISVLKQLPLKCEQKQNK